MISNPQLELAWKFVEFTNKNIFLTGKAGTGKTTFLHTLKARSPKRCVVVAPTGVAAINAGGVTIHSFFQMPFGPFIPAEGRTENAENPAGYTRMSKTKINIIRSLDLLIIDEISMVRADLLDGIDEVLRRYRRTTKSFGGVQLLMIGDIRQLSPVVREEDRKLLSPYYSNFYFYGSRALQKTDFISIELTEVFRQKDQHFIDILNAIRTKGVDPEKLAKLNTRYIPGFKETEHEGYIILTTHNHKAAEINNRRLTGLDSPEFSREAIVGGDFPEYLYPTEFRLVLKTGAQVMFVKNDPSPEKQFYNGKIGCIEKIDEEEEIVYVRCPEDEDIIAVERLRWENCRYSLNHQTKEIEEEVIGHFTQFPLKLAWAITIHKSQGLTFEKAVIDAQESFAHGQVYVAMSRCRSLEGLVLSTPISLSSIKTDPLVARFSKEVEDNPPTEIDLNRAREKYERELVLELFDFGTLRRSLLSCLNTIQEYKSSFLPEVMPVMKDMFGYTKEEMEKVGKKFIQQLQQIYTEGKAGNRDVLQERIRKGAQYFQEKLDGILWNRLGSISTVSDNQQAEKQLKNRLEILKSELNIKRACLESCGKGFELHRYLEARAKASIEKPKIRKPEAAQEDLSLSELEHPGLFARLRQWRNGLASDQDLPAYRIMSQQALLGLASKMPGSLPELVKIKGIGRRTAEKYGEQVLDLIAGYCRDNGLDYVADRQLKIPEGKKKETRKDTLTISLEFFQQGKNVEEIASARGMSPITIEGHMALLVEEGRISVDRFLDEASLKEITACIERMEETRLNPLREALKEKYSYSELKMAIGWMKWKDSDTQG